VAALLRGHALAALLRCWALSNTNSRCKKISKPIHGRKHFFQVATPVQITVTVDSNGAVTGFQAVGNSGDAMGAKVVSAAEAAAIALSNQTKATLTGAAAVAALTAKWEEDQASIAAVNARMKENAAAMSASAAAQRSAIVMSGSWTPMVRSASTAFMGMTSEQMKANVAGRLLEQTLGLQNRAINQVISRSALLGPLMSAAFPIAIIASVVPMFARIGEAIINTTNDLGGYTSGVKKIREETIKASQEAFLNPKTLEFGQLHLNQLNSQITVLGKAQAIEVSRSQMMSEQTTLEGKITALLFAGTINNAASAATQAKVLAIEQDRQKILESITTMTRQLNDEVARSQESTALIGKSGFSKIAQEHQNALADISRNYHLDASQDPAAIANVNRAAAAARLDADQRMTAQTMELRRQEAMETMQLQDQTTENALTGIAKIKQEETDQINRALVEDMQKMGLSAAEVKQTALYQAQIAKIHQDTSDKITAYDRQQDERVRVLQEEAIKSSLTGDAAIIASGQKKKEELGKQWAQGLLDDTHYNAAIRAINQETNNKIQANDQKTTDKHAEELAKTKAMQDRADEDMRTAQEDAALAALPEWQRASAQIEIELNRRERAIEDQKIKELAAEHLTQDQIVAINQDADAKRYDAIVQTNMRIQEENKRMVEQFGGDLQSVFDDMTSGNIGKRILSNMEKLFFQIVAQWILSLNVMKSAAGSIFGSIVFGPGSTGANVFGGGSGGGGPLSILGSLFGGSGSSAPSGAAFQPGGIFSDPSTFAGGTAPIFAPQSGLSGAIAGTGATPGAGLLPSASNALTSATMSDALVGIGAAGGGAASAASGAQTAGGLSAFFGGAKGLLAGATPLAAMLLGSSGGKVGSIGGILTGLLLTGKLGSLIQPLTLGAGGLQIAAVSGLAAALTGGLIGFGIGQGHGGILGSLAGAGTGALAGLMVGGPVGALVGGIVGLLGGVFGGIFGSSKRKKQANALADNTLLPDITQISNGFDGFQIDSSSAIQQLEQLRTDSQKQLSALKGQGNDVFNLKVTPAINAAEQHIRDTQAERDRRSSLAFGPPQFDTGGMFSMMTGSKGLAVLDHGEIVINPVASKKNLSTLANINAGGTGGGFHIGGDFVIKTGHLDRDYVRSGSFRKDLLDAMNQARAEGAQF
jgi:hypothetical protein